MVLIILRIGVLVTQLGTNFKIEKIIFKYFYMNSLSILNRAADNIRILAASAVEKAKSGKSC